jgi:hypothetical protein
MDMNPVTDEAKASMAKTCGEIQEVMKKYRKQIVDANKKLPRHGMQWYALEKALKRLDDGLRDDMGEVEVEVEYTRLSPSLSSRCESVAEDREDGRRDSPSSRPSMARP